MGGMRVLWQAKYQKQEKEADGVGKETVKMKVKNQSAWNAVATANDQNGCQQWVEERRH